MQILWARVLFRAAAVSIAIGLTAAGPINARPVRAGLVYGDPVRYCRAVQTADDPLNDHRYKGPASTSAMTRLFDLLPDEARDQYAVQWRCMRGTVYVCYDYSNPTACSGGIVDPQRKTTPQEREWEKSVQADIRRMCRQYPNTECVPATHCMVACQGGQPVKSARFSQPVDERGYSPDEWKELVQ